MIDPLPRGVPYPARLPPLREQWGRLNPAVRTAVVGVPVLVIAVVLIASVVAGAAVAVMLVGAGAATAVYVKNRTDRHNAAIERGEIPLVEDPHLQRPGPLDANRLGAELVGRLRRWQWPLDDTTETVRFDGGWILKRRSRAELALVVGDDGGRAYFDRRWVTDLWAASEYRAGRGREPSEPGDEAVR